MKTSYPRVKRAKLNLDKFDPDTKEFSWSTRVLLAQRKARKEAKAKSVTPCRSDAVWPWHVIEIKYHA